MVYDMYVCWPYVIHMMAVCSSRIECMTWTYVRRMLDVCWTYVGRMLDVCWTYVGETKIHISSCGLGEPVYLDSFHPARQQSFS